VTVAIAAIAGGGAIVPVALGVAMTGLQTSIGAVDAVGRPEKPLPAGLVGRRAVLALAVAAAGVGVVLASLVAPSAGVVAVAILAVGYAYDLAFKGTPWSWLPFAVGIPLLPVFAWLGAAGRIPDAFAVLVPAAVAAGTGLALGNSLVDLDGDASAGLATPAQAWGARVVASAAAALLAAVGVAALVSAWLAGAPLPTVLAIAALGLGLVVAGRWATRPQRIVRERAWQVQAAGIGALAAAWLGGLAIAGRLS
jgi:4-hydroxybenzoate polyprenyltransferase